jgi:hypothetical protein
MKQNLLLQAFVIIYFIILASSSIFESDSSRDEGLAITKNLGGKIFILPKEALKINDRFGIDKILLIVRKANEMRRIFDHMKKVVKDLKDLHVSSSRLR